MNIIFPKKLNILTYPNEILTKISTKVEKFDYKLRDFLLKMLQKMREEDGIGLAAPQVGVLLQIATIGIGDPFFIINPKILYISKEEDNMYEGCLSLPDDKYIISRPKEIELKYQNEYGDVKVIKAEGLLSKCIQHEIDHLHGITINIKNHRQKSKLT